MPSKKKKAAVASTADSDSASSYEDERLAAEFARTLAELEDDETDEPVLCTDDDPDEDREAADREELDELAEERHPNISITIDDLRKGILALEKVRGYIVYVYIH